MKTVTLSKFTNIGYKPGFLLKRTLWYLTKVLFFVSPIVYPHGFKSFLLRLFGAKVGKRLVIRPSVNIKYPWFLEIGDSVWIGQDVWIDNPSMIKISSNVCISQGAYLVTGSHDYKSADFKLILKDIIISDGVWIGAKAIVCPGVKCESHSVLTAGSVATGDLEAYKIYQGNPAVYKRDRVIQ